MKKLTIAALLGGQMLITAQPASAADLRRDASKSGWARSADVACAFRSAAIRASGRSAPA